MKDTLLGIPRTALEVFEMLPEGTLCEVIDNIMYFPPSRTTTHQEVLGDIILEMYEKAQTLGEMLPGPCDVYLDNGESIVTPDLFFIKADRAHIVEKRGIKGSPDLIFELLSTNAWFDKENKFELYQRNGVSEYFIIDPETKEVWHYLLIDGMYVLQTATAGQLNIHQLSLEINF